MSKDGIKFSDPPDVPGEEATKFATALRSRPGEWAVYDEDAASSLVTRINQGIAAGFSPAGDFEATGRTVSWAPRRRFKVWVRYVGRGT